jgi:hypothetical protein
LQPAIRLVSVLILIFAGTIRPGSAQQPRTGQNAGSAPPWMQFEKQLGLQATYACDMTMQMMGMTMDSRIVRDGGRTRTEMTMPMMNLRMVALEIPAGGQTGSYALFPDQKKYVVNDEAAQARAAAAAAEPVIEELGTETYEGEACIKRRVTVVQQGIRSDMTMLFSPRLKNMPVKMVMNATVPAGPGQAGMPIQSTVLFKNYDFAKPADSLFAIPADYVRAPSMQTIMMESMGNLGAMMKQMAPPAGPK